MEKSRNATDGDGRGGKKNPSSASVSSLLVFIASFVCTVAERQKNAKGVLRRGEPPTPPPREATWEGKGSPLKCTLIAAKQQKKNERGGVEGGGAGKQQWPPAVSGSVGEVAEIGIQPSSLIGSPYLLLLLLLCSSNSPLLL